MNIDVEPRWSETFEVRWNHGGLSFRSETLHVCACCHVQTEATFVANGDTHRVNRSGEPCTIDVGLCVKCWSRLLRN
jgi:hypothetical protein